MMQKIGSKKTSRILIFGSLLLVAVAIRVFLLHIVSPDITVFEGVWYDQFIKVGRIDAFKEIFYNYQPPLLYLIDVTTLFRFIPKEVAIKLISVIFDFSAACAVFKILEWKFPGEDKKWFGFFGLLLLPTVFIESGMWGQSDIIYTSFLIWSLYFLLKSKNLSALFFFSVAFAFKLQALFFAPIFVILFFRRKIPFWMFFIIPVVYFISVVPAWLCGGPLGKLLTMYFTQFNTYQALSMRAPNLYLFINPGDWFTLIVRLGMAITFLVVVGYIVVRLIKIKDLRTESLCLDAAMLTFFIPFLLPKMHERYFFAGGLFLLLIALVDRKFIWAAILAQASALLAYIPYFSGWSDVFAKIGSVLNVLLLTGLVFFFIDYHKSVDLPESAGQVVGAKG